ncbi:MAG: hypothetical protein ACE5JO_10670, partial [Candidatus Binatia bacterium]
MEWRRQHRSLGFDTPWFRYGFAYSTQGLLNRRSLHSQICPNRQSSIMNQMDRALVRQGIDYYVDSHAKR